MDDIQDFITDHHYNQAIRKHSVIDPEDAIAQAVLDPWPQLPKNIATSMAVEEYAKSLNFKDLYGTPIGRYFMVEKLLKEGKISNTDYTYYCRITKTLEDYQLEKHHALPVVERFLNLLEKPLQQTKFSESVKHLNTKFRELTEDYYSQRQVLLKEIEDEIESKLHNDGQEPVAPVSTDMGSDKSFGSSPSMRNSIGSASAIGKQDGEETGDKNQDEEEDDDQATSKRKPRKERSSAISMASRMLSELIDVDDVPDEHVEALLELEEKFQSRYLSFFDELEEAVKKFFEEGYNKMIEDMETVAKYRQLEWYACQKKIQMNDFVIFRDLGRGAFGVVSGARHRITGQLVALKGMNRKLIKGKKVLKLVKQEFEILKKLGEYPSPFCVSLSYAFMDDNNMYFGLPLMTGGDLMYHICRQHRGYGLERARFFAAQIALGLQHMHNLGVIYRDLKPENVLLDDVGNTKISDMGLAVLVKFTPYTRGNKLIRGRAGTPGYWPPEMIKGEGYAFDCDWWSWAVMLYELIVGVCPFSEHHTKMKDRNDATLNYVLQFPQLEDGPFPDDAKDLISRMLERDRTKRLGTQPDAAEQIKSHAFFRSIDWSKLETKNAIPPFKPPASINAVSQADLEVRNKEAKFKKLVLTEEDKIPGFNFKSRDHLYDVELVLHLERKGKLHHLKSKTSSHCIIL